MDKRGEVGIDGDVEGEDGTERKKGERVLLESSQEKDPTRPEQLGQRRGPDESENTEELWTIQACGKTGRPEGVSGVSEAR